jgi:hypothetical protein
MNDAACSCLVMIGRICLECLSASVRAATFSPLPPNAARTPTLSSPLTIAS